MKVIVRRRNLFLPLFLLSLCIFSVTFNRLLNVRTDRSEIQQPIRKGFEVENKAGKHMELKLLCFFPVHNNSINTKGVAARDTWGRKCDKLLVVGDVNNDSFPAIKMGVPGRKYLWSKIRDTFLHLYDNYLDQYEWFFKGDDNTFVIVENLKFFLSQYDPHKSWFFGHRFNKFLKEGYVSGGSGYVISRGALAKLGPLLKKNRTKQCAPRIPEKFRGEDFRFAECMEEIGVVPSPTLDWHNRELFHVWPLGNLWNNISGGWYADFNYYKHKPGRECCSDHSISFHNLDPKYMYIMDFLVYNLRPVF